LDRTAPPSPSPSEPSLYAEWLPRVGLLAAEVPAVLAAEAYSRRQLQLARACLAVLAPELWRFTATFALGSLGRLEASRESDLDLAFVYDGDRLDHAQAQAARTDVIARLTASPAGYGHSPPLAVPVGYGHSPPLAVPVGYGHSPPLAVPAGFDIPEKTFDQAIDLRSLTRNIGGRFDTNETLTYRALLLTEGACLSGDGSAIKQAVFRAYADAQISRGRFLASLGNDLHRYYRTLCMDYRHKVEELDKSWAIRVLKLRHSRKLWHLANLALQCWTVDAIADDAERDAALAGRIDWPSLLRLVAALEHFGAPELARAPFLCFDRFLAALARADVRRELAGLEYERRRESAVYCELHENATQLDAAGAAIVELLLQRCRSYLVRFCIL
jgi:hypothetical protein